MDIRLNLHRPDDSKQDIFLTVDATATIRAVAGRVAEADPRKLYDAGSTYTLQVASPVDAEWRLLPPDALVGDDWLVSGNSIALVEEQAALPALGKTAGAAKLIVLNGHEHGRTEELGRGSHVVGRDASADVVLADQYMSKRHFRIDVGRTVEIVDLGSANGIEIDEQLVPRARVTESLEFFAGSTEFRLDVIEETEQDTPVPVGSVRFNRSPRIDVRFNGKRFPVPQVPKLPEPQTFPLLAMIAPILMGGAMFAMTQRPMTLLFIAMTPLMMVGQYLTGNKRNKSKLGRQIKDFDAGLAELAERLDEDMLVEREVRLREVPDTKTALRAVSEMNSLLWTRRMEHWNFLNFRVGNADLPSRNTVDSNHRQGLMVEFQERLDEVVAAHSTVPDVPMVVSLHEAGAVGVAGVPEHAAEAVAAIVTQLTALHSPAELVVGAALTPEWAQRLDWLKWLPHTASAHSPLSAHLGSTPPAVSAVMDGLEQLVAEREAQSRRGSTQLRGAIAVDGSSLEGGADVGTASGPRVQSAPLPAVLFLVSDDAALNRARMVDLAERGADVGVYPVWLSDAVESLPAVCRAYVDLTDVDAPRVGLVRLSESFEATSIERVSIPEATAFARSLARVSDANVPTDDQSDVPSNVMLAELIDVDILDRTEAAIDRWVANQSIADRTGGERQVRKRPGRLRATVGQSSAGVMHLDLRTQGPHALVGGTTGSGKSEFLQAWVLGLAAEYSPDRVTFLFVDYKGGAAFAECIKLPHAVGLVTDLNQHLVRRALTSLRAELHHREELLSRKGAKDLLELEKRGDPDAPPSLVIMIDEFAALANEVPEFVDGVVDIAQRGRSLGIHLVMATQRPAGVIRDNLRANTNLRIALRMADESDSTDVIGVKDAAHFDPGLPGRGIVKTGPGRLEVFQSGYAGGWSQQGESEARIDIADLAFSRGGTWTVAASEEVGPDRDLGATDQERIVRVLTQAAVTSAIPTPRRPWLDELPLAIDLASIADTSDQRVVLGLSDIPERQAQQPVAFAPDQDGHVAVYGTGGSGKSVVLRTLAAAFSLAKQPVHIYGLDFGSGALRAIESLPSVGAVIVGDDAERIIRLLRMLRAEMDRRSRLYSSVHAANLSEYREMPGNAAEPRIVILLDNYPGFRDDWEIPSGRSQWYRVLLDVIALGRPLGIHVALTADRPGSIPGAVASGIQKRVVLRLADDIGYGTLDVPKDVLDASSPAGRALIGEHELQIAILGGSQTTADQIDALAALAEAQSARGVVPAPAIASLAEVVSIDAVPPSDELIMLGVAEESLEPIGFEPVGAFVIAGPPESGRTNALSVVVDRLLGQGFDVSFIGPRRSRFAHDDRISSTASRVEDVVELVAGLKSRVMEPEHKQRFALIIESLSDYLQTPADAPLVDLIKTMKREDHFVVGEAETGSWVSSWPLFAELKNARRGLLLRPDATDGDVVLKTSLPRGKANEFPEGRGYLVTGGKVARVQVAKNSEPDGTE